MSQKDLLLDRNSSLRVELQLQPSVSAMDREHALNQMQKQLLCGKFLKRCILFPYLLVLAPKCFTERMVCSV